MIFKRETKNNKHFINLRGFVNHPHLIKGVTRQGGRPDIDDGILFKSPMEGGEHNYFWHQRQHCVMSLLCVT